MCLCVKWIDGTGNQATLSPRAHNSKTHRTPTTVGAAVARLLSGWSDLSVLRSGLRMRAGAASFRPPSAGAARAQYRHYLLRTYSSRTISGWICFTIGEICLQTREPRVRTIHGLVLFRRNDHLSPMVLLIDATSFGIGRVCPTYLPTESFDAFTCVTFEAWRGRRFFSHRRCRY